MVPDSRLAGTDIEDPVAVVIPVHNGWAHSRLCLRALVNSGYDPLTVFIVDDGSTDGTSEQIAREFPRVVVVKGDGSLWWAGAMNAGMREAFEAGNRYVFVLNNDVTVGRDAIREVVKYANDHPRTLVGSLIADAAMPGTVWCAGGTMRWPWPGETMLGGGDTVTSYVEPRAVEWLPGMGTLIPRELADALGGYDAKRMPQYLADTDFALRARARGWHVVMLPRSVLLNDVSNTGGTTSDSAKFTPREAAAVFTSRRSPDYLSARTAFIARHCPPRWLIPALVIRYSRLLGFILRRLL